MNSERRIPVAELWRLIGAKMQRKALLLVVLGLLGVVAELLTIGAIVPLLYAVVDPAGLASLPVIGSFVAELARSNAVGLGPVGVLALAMSVLAIGSAAIRLLLGWRTYDFAFGIHARIVQAMYEGVLSQQYGWFLKRNSGDFLATVDKVYAMVVNLALSAIQAVPAAVMTILASAFLMLLNPRIAVALLLTIGLFYGAASLMVMRSVRRISRDAAALRNRRARFAQELWGSSRDIIIDRSHEMYLAQVERHEGAFKDIHVKANIAGVSPRILLDALLVIMIAAVILAIGADRESLLASLPFLGAFAVAGQRLLPLIQQIYLSYVNYRLYSAYLDDAMDYARLAPAFPVTRGKVDLPFVRNIRMTDVSFSYDDCKPSLRDVNLNIERGQCIGIVGKSGSGKTTLVDLLMGLLEPGSGTIEIDDKALTAENVAAWRSHIAHVPQSVFLTDSTLLANVAMAGPREDADEARVRDACIAAGLGEFLDQGGDGLMRQMGERGVQLSGGQLQRIGLARALYKGADVLVLDEATSALDRDTERDILDRIFALGPSKTVIMISHRTASLERCDEVFIVEDRTVRRRDG